MAVYLLHFDKPLKHARHYLGYADDIEARLERHRAGNGSRLMAVVTKAGITWQLVRTWSGDRAFERRLKSRHNTPALCQICNASALNHAKETIK